MPYKDVQQRRDYQNAYHHEKSRTDPVYKSKHRARARARNAKQVSLIDELVTAFRSNGCSLCPERSICCLVAHHVDPAQKDFSIAHAKTKRLGAERVKAELSKCICLCANCHAKLHAGEVSLTAVVA